MKNLAILAMVLGLAGFVGASGGCGGSTPSGNPDVSEEIEIPDAIGPPPGAEDDEPADY